MSPTVLLTAWMLFAAPAPWQPPGYDPNFAPPPPSTYFYNPPGGQYSPKLQAPWLSWWYPTIGPRNNGYEWVGPPNVSP